MASAPFIKGKPSNNAQKKCVYAMLVVHGYTIRPKEQ